MERVVLMPIFSKYAFTASAVNRSSTMLVAVLSLSTIIRFVTSRSGSCTLSESSLPMTPEPLTLSSGRTVSMSLHLALPLAT
jgi:hypothetical protein